MSTQNSRNKNTIKKIKLDDVDKDVNSIAEYKRCATLRYCKENDTKKHQLDEVSISKKLHNLGLYSFFLINY